MATGTIGGAMSAVAGQVSHGEVQTTQHLANRVATIAYLYKYRPGYIFVTHRHIWRIAGTAWPTVAEQYVEADGATQTVYIEIPTSGVTSSGSVYQKITAINFYVDPAGAGVIDCRWNYHSAWGSAAPTITNLGSVGSSGTAYQVVTTGAIDIGATDDRKIVCTITSAASGDRFYGIRATVE